MTKEFDIDVSGEDIFNHNYTIVVADKNNIIKGYKINRNNITILLSRYGQEHYRYKKSNAQKSLFKIRIYCILIYYIFKEIYEQNKNLDKKIILNVCKDFDGHKNDVLSNFKFFLEQKLLLKIESFKYEKLLNSSLAHRYAYILRKDEKNQYPNYIKIKIEEIEEFLKK